MNTDCISRQAVIDSLYDWSNHSMTDAETWHLRQVIGDIKSMPSVTPQLSSELEKNSKKLEKDFGELDCISRADAIQAMQDTAKKLTNEDTINGLCGAVAILFELPSVTPQEPKTGYWKDIPKYKDIAWQCSVCKHFTTMKHNYCPNCGAKMVESQESEDKE